MTVVTRIPRTSRISTMIDKPGGVSVGVALARATRNLETLRGRGLELATEAVAAISALPVPGSRDEAQAAAQEAYQLSAGLIDATGPFGLTDLCTAAAGLCDLLDATTDQIDWRIVTVHAQSMRMLLVLPEEDRASRDAILSELRRVLARRLPPLDG